MLYNEEVKNMFLDRYPESTRKTYLRIFKKSYPTEKMLEKDLYEFNLDEIDSVLYDLRPLTFKSSLTNGRIITEYITFCIEQGLRSNNINPLRMVKSPYFEKFVDKNIKTLFSKNEIMQIEDACNNAQDAVILALLFEGAWGKELSEIRNLKREHVDFENRILTLIDHDGSERQLQVSQRCIDLIEKALQQDRYWKRNGEMDTTSNRRPRDYTDLVMSNYVIRASITKTDTYSKPVQISVIHRRLQTLSDVFGIPYLNPKNVVNSGMLYMAKNLYEKTGKIGKEEYQQIAERFGVKDPYTMRTYITEENLEKVYGKEIANTQR